MIRSDVQNKERFVAKTGDTVLGDLDIKGQIFSEPTAEADPENVLVTKKYVLEKVAGLSAGGPVAAPIVFSAPLAATAGTVGLPKASGAADGYLSSADFAAFAAKQNALGAASAAASGILTSADWSTFNGKQAALGFASAGSPGILSSADWNTFAGKQAPLSQASAGANGFLAAGDWSRFNAKQDALGFAGAGSNGILSAGDWNVFNAKQDKLGVASSAQSGILSASDWLKFNNKQDRMLAATATNSGFLHETDWARFNAKQDALLISSQVTFRTVAASDGMGTSTTLSSNGIGHARPTDSGFSLSSDGTTVSLINRGTGNLYLAFPGGGNGINMFGAKCIGVNSQPDTAYRIRIGGSAFSSISTGWTTSSDRRLKADIQLADGARMLDAVANKLKIYHYRWRDAQPRYDKRQLGFLADELEQVFPHSVSELETPVELDDGTEVDAVKAVDVAQSTFMLFGAFQEYMRRTDDRIRVLEEQINEMANGN